MLDREQKSATEPEVGRGPRWPRSPASQQGRARSAKPRRRIQHHDRLGVSSVFEADWCDQHPRRNWFSYWPPKALQTPPHFSARISSVTLARVRPSATPPRDPVTDGASSAPWDSGDRSRPCLVLSKHHLLRRDPAAWPARPPGSRRCRVPRWRVSPEWTRHPHLPAELGAVPTRGA